MYLNGQTCGESRDSCYHCHQHNYSQQACHVYSEGCTVLLTEDTIFMKWLMMIGDAFWRELVLGLQVWPVFIGKPGG